MDYTGPNSIFIRVLLDKKYALPYKVVDALVFHFISFKRSDKVMPVLWYQSFLVFVQRCVFPLLPLSCSSSRTIGNTNRQLE